MAKNRHEKAEERPAWVAALDLIAEVGQQLQGAKAAAEEALGQELQLLQDQAAISAALRKLDEALAALQAQEKTLDAFGLAEMILVAEEAVELAKKEGEEKLVELAVQAEEAVAGVTPEARELVIREASAHAKAEAKAAAEREAKLAAQEAEKVAEAKQWIGEEFPKTLSAARAILGGADVTSKPWQRIQAALDGGDGKGPVRVSAELSATAAIRRFGLSEERAKELEDFAMAERKKRLPRRRGQPRVEGEDKPAPPMTIEEFGGEPAKKQDGPLVSVLLDKLPASEREKAGRIVTDLLKVARQVGRPINGEAYVTRTGRIRLRLLDSGQTYPLDGTLAEKLLA